MRQKTFAVLVCVVCFMPSGVYSQYRAAYFLPHIANGTFPEGSFRTTFILFNNTDSRTTVDLRLTGDDGKPLVVTIPGLGTESVFTFDLAPGATRIVQTDGSGGLVAGAAAVIADAMVGVSAIFSVYDANGNFVTEAGVGDSEPVSDFVIPVDVTGDFNTGLALFNMQQIETSVDFKLRDATGKEVDKVSLKMAPGEHLARFVAGPRQLFPAVTNFRGTLSVTSSTQLPVLTLRQNSKPLSYTSLPAVHNSNIGPLMFLAQVANGTSGSVGFKTSFLILNPHPMAASVKLSLTKSEGTPFPVTLQGKGTADAFDFTIAPNGSVFLQTDGTGPMAIGAATISSQPPVGVAGIFSVFDSQGRFQTEAGVGAASRMWSVTLPVDITGRFDTGLALFNPNSTPIDLTLTLMALEGEVKEVRSKLTLPAMNQTARFVSELFPGTSNFRGSLAVSGPGVVALTLRQNLVPLSYTTLPVKQGVSSGRIQPLLTQIRTDIAATGDIVVNEVLGPGFKLSGNIIGGGYPSLIAAQSATGEIFVGRYGSSSSGSKYVLVLPAGTYSLKLCYSAQDGDGRITFTDPKPVQVSADTARDIVVPPVDQIGVSGTISGMSSLPQTPAKSVVFSSTDNTVWAQLLLQDDGRYSGRIPAGSYRANMYLPNARLSEVRLQNMTLFNFGSVTVGSSPVVANFAVPVLARLSGLGAGNLIRATDRTAPAIAQDSCGYFPAYNTSDVDPSGQYQMVLVKDRNYDVQSQLSVIRGQDYAGTLLFPSPGVVSSFTGDTRLDFSQPSLPGEVVITGRVTDSAGRGVGKVDVGALSQSITGVPNAQLSNLERTDALGNYRIVVLSGTNYRLIFMPPIPAP